MIRSVLRPTETSWVTMRKLKPCSTLSRRMSSTISAAFSLSRSPVGSSAQTMAGSLTSARAIVTRWRSPPESSSGRCEARAARPTRPRASSARRRALEALDLVGIADRAEHVPDELSGGERQRVTIARSLVNDPAIVWADEPTGDLDSENAQEIVALMRRLNVERGLSFLIVTHDIAVGRQTDRIVRMLDGTVVEEQQLEVPHVLAGHAA